ncbi:MAG: DUF4340 domain-containing protein [Clostridiales bacterium]|nr:DUF4340 domain-containing protein [Clostridiales bacterium]
MKRSKKLILLCVALVLVIVSYTVISYIQKNKPVEESKDGQEVESDSSYQGYGHVLDFTVDDVQSVHIKNALDDFTINYTEEKENDPDFHWTIEGHEEWTLDHTSVNNTLELTTSLFANRMADPDAVANERNLEDFGLAEPISTISATFKDGTSETIYVGNRTADGQYYYGMVEGDNAIYTLGRNAGNTATFTTRNLRFINSLDIHKEASEIYYLLIENADGRNTELTYAGINDKGDTLEYYNAGVMKMSYGENFAYDKQFFVTGNLADIFQAMPDTILPEEQIEDHATDLDKYGLGEKPVHHVVLTFRTEVTETEMSEFMDAIDAGYDTTLTKDDFILDEETGMHYLYTTNEYTFGNEYTNEEGKQMVYFRFAKSDDVLGVPKSEVDKFEFDPYMYVQRVLYMNNIDNVESMKFTIQGQTYDLEFKRGEATVDEDGNKVQDQVFKINGQLIEEKAFRGLYTTLIGIMSDYEIYGEDPEIDENDTLKIEYVFLDGSTHEITYYRAGEFYYVTKVGDKTWFACAYTQFQDILDQLDVCLNGGE